MERVSSGVSGLDKLMKGGVLQGDVTVIAGAAGAGKTVFACQYMYDGLKKGDSCVYISFEETPNQIKRNMLEFGWDFSNYEAKSKMLFVKYDPFHLEDIYGLIENQVRSIGAKRIVIDSLTAMTINMKETADVRISIYKLGALLKKLNCTSTMLAESPPTNRDEFTKFGVEEFVADNVIVLYYYPIKGKFRRALTVWKMRGSQHDNSIHPYKIEEHGIVVQYREETSLG